MCIVSKGAAIIAKTKYVNVRLKYVYINTFARRVKFQPTVPRLACWVVQSITLYSFNEALELQIVICNGLPWQKARKLYEYRKLITNTEEDMAAHFQ